MFIQIYQTHEGILYLCLLLYYQEHKGSHRYQETDPHLPPCLGPRSWHIAVRRMGRTSSRKIRPKCSIQIASGFKI